MWNPKNFTARAVVNWTAPLDNWRWRQTAQPDGPWLHPVGHNHTLPSDTDGKLLDQLFKARKNYSRMLWGLDAERGTNLPQFVEKALKLFNLKQVAYEVETSVMSKVSCTACQAGAGLLQHYIRTGKSEAEIKKTIYQFCVSLKIQTARVCEGVTRLFGVCRIIFSTLFGRHREIFDNLCFSKTWDPNEPFTKIYYFLLF